MKRLVLLVLILTLTAVGCAHQSGDKAESGQRLSNATPPSSPVSSETTAVEDTALDDDDFDETTELVSDPMAPLNKAMFHFNDKLYFWVIKPVSQGYGKVVPEGARIGVSNFFYNLLTPIRLVGNLLQGKLEQSGAEITRFVLNTTAGCLGFANPSQHFKWLNPPEEDIGQALGSYGIANGFYIVWPFFGPSTLRDTFGMAGDMALNPITYVDPLALSAGIRAYQTINQTSFRIGDYEALKDSAIDPYEAFRNAYIQYRNKQISE